jgi:hypothetical protein
MMAAFANAGHGDARRSAPHAIAMLGWTGAKWRVPDLSSPGIVAIKCEVEQPSRKLHGQERVTF